MIIEIYTWEIRKSLREFVERVGNLQHWDFHFEHTKDGVKGVFESKLPIEQLEDEDENTN